MRKEKIVFIKKNENNSNFCSIDYFAINYVFSANKAAIISVSV